MATEAPRLREISGNAFRSSKRGKPGTGSEFRNCSEIRAYFAAIPLRGDISVFDAFSGEVAVGKASVSLLVAMVKPSEGFESPPSPPHF